MFDTGVLDEQEDVVEKEISTAELVATAGEVVTTASVEVSAATTTTTTIDELTLAQTLIEIKAAKPKVVTTTATTVTLASTRSKAKGIVFHDQEEQTPASTPIVSASQLLQAKDKGKEKMVEPEKPLKKKDQIIFDKELAKQREEDANIAEWDKVQAMIDADYELAVRLQTEEQEELTIEEKSKLFVELMDKRKKHFVKLIAEEQRRKPLTRA
ncbi:hypothetical protein Tco_0672248 [Tanacetum coccineum]